MTEKEAGEKQKLPPWDGDQDEDFVLKPLSSEEEDNLEDVEDMIFGRKPATLWIPGR